MTVRRLFAALFLAMLIAAGMLLAPTCSAVSFEGVFHPSGCAGIREKDAIAAELRALTAKTEATSEEARRLMNPPAR